MHLVFYDGECGLCDHVVQWLLKVDQSHQFLFAPLNGETAAKKLQNVPERVKTADSIILIENYQQTDEVTYIYGKAALRICWLLGGGWAILGILSFIPSFFYDWVYWIVAKIRYQVFGKKTVCSLPETPIDKSRFLP